MDEWMDGWMGGWVDGWMGGWVDGWMGSWMDGWVNKSIIERLLFVDRYRLHLV